MLYTQAEDTGKTKRQREKKKERDAERKERRKEAKEKREAEIVEPMTKPDIGFGERNDAPLDRLAAPMRRMRETGTDIVHRKDKSEDEETGEDADGKKRRGKGKKVEDMQLTLARQSLIDQYRAKKSRKRLDPKQFIM